MYNDFRKSVVARPSVHRKKSSRVNINVVIEEESKEEEFEGSVLDFFVYEVHKEKFNFFKGTKNNWVKHNLQLENLNQYDLWQISMCSDVNEANGKGPEEIFLLQTVEQITTGMDPTLKLSGEGI